MSDPAQEQLAYLWRSANEHAHEAPALSRLYAHRLIDVAARAKLPLPSRALNRICSGCYTLVVPGLDCQVSHREHKRRPASRRHSLRVHCQHCGQVSTFPLPARRSSRSSTAPDAKARSGKAVEAKPAAKKSSAIDKGAAASRVAAAVGQRGSSGRKLTPSASSGSSGLKRAAPPQPAPRAPGASGGDGLFGFDFVPL
jgi:RNase P subunit RPR2